MTDRAEVQSTNLKRLGFFLDGYAVLIPAKGGLANEVQQKLHSDLSTRSMPDVVVRRSNANVGMMSENRPYTITATSPGASTTIYVGNYGIDLYASWRTYIRPVINWRVVGGMAGISALFSLCGAIFNFITATTMGSLGNGYGFYQPSIGEQFQSTIGRLFGAGICSVGYFVIWMLALALLVALAGMAIKRNPLAFFILEPNIFDAEDITAMSMTAHNALLNALESAGIDRELLRSKDQFKSRPGEVV